ncbi:MAG: hypothetical protein LUD79_02535 [Oscillospiraceae bacterium]|nr:hypothetical protein [Oscillospiraceae bacterium]
MNKNVIDTERFVECLYELRQIVIEHQEKNQPISFKKGFLEEQEGYKRKSYSDAKAAFKKLNYEKEGALCGWLMDSLKRNNLIDWRDYKYLQYDAKLENLLYRIYVDPTENDEALFEEAIQFFGRRYPIISYIFFLKDMEKYLPVRPRIFQKRFQFLGVDIDCLNRCTWENYQTFCSMIGRVRELLNGSNLFKKDEDVELIDAHSFVWMMWLLEEPDEQSDLRHVDLRVFVN